MKIEKRWNLALQRRRVYKTETKIENVEIKGACWTGSLERGRWREDGRFGALDWIVGDGWERRVELMPSKGVCWRRRRLLVGTEAPWAERVSLRRRELNESVRCLASKAREKVRECDERKVHRRP